MLAKTGSTATAAVAVAIAIAAASLIKGSTSASLRGRTRPPFTVDKQIFLIG